MPPFQPDFLTILPRLGFIALLLAVCFVVAARFRNLWGTTAIAVMAGLFQVPQAVLGFGLSIEVFQGVAVSAGSILFFPATLFSVLLVYVLEDAVEARRLIYSLLISNIALAVLMLIGLPLFDAPGVNDRLGLDTSAATRIARILIVGAGLLAVDSFILIWAFEWFGENVARNVLARALFGLGLSLTFDALAFSLVTFGTRPRFGALLAISLIGKLLAASFYSLVFVFLLPWSRMSGERELSARPNRTSGPVTYKERFQDLQKVAVRDQLTGVFNRSYFDHELRAQTDRAILRDERLLLLLIDLDAFKQINDTHGHPTGDRVLALFGEALRAVARQNDTVCRYGGEEFAILIAGGPASIGPGLFERTTEEFARLWQGASPPLPCLPPRFSVGGAAIPADSRSSDELLAIADRRLYESKRAGGDRLTIA